MQNHYVTLEVRSTATQAEIKKSYYRLVRLHHPDKNAEADGEVIRKINEAYAVLSNQAERAVYDRKLAASTRSLQQFTPKADSYYSKPTPGQYYQRQAPQPGQSTTQFPSQQPSNGFARSSSYTSSQYWNQRHTQGPPNSKPTYQYNNPEEFYSYQRNQSFEGQYNNWNSFGPGSQNHRPPQPQPQPQPQHQSKQQQQQTNTSTSQKTTAGSNIKTKQTYFPSMSPSPQPQPQPQTQTTKTSAQTARHQTNDTKSTSEYEPKIPPGAKLPEKPFPSGWHPKAMSSDDTHNVPQSWEKQTYQFNQKTDSRKPNVKAKTNRNDVKSSSDESNRSTDQPIPIPIPIPIPLHSSKKTSSFTFSNINIPTGTTRAAPQRIFTARNNKTTYTRTPPLHNSRVPLKESVHKNSSGRTPRTAVEDNIRVDFVPSDKHNDSITSDSSDIEEIDSKMFESIQKKNEREKYHDAQDFRDIPASSSSSSSTNTSSIPNKKKSPQIPIPIPVPQQPPAPRTTYRKIFADMTDLAETSPLTETSGNIDMTKLKNAFMDISNSTKDIERKETLESINKRQKTAPPLNKIPIFSPRTFEDKVRSERRRTSNNPSGRSVRSRTRITSSLSSPAALESDSDVGIDIDEDDDELTENENEEEKEKEKDGGNGIKEEGVVVDSDSDMDIEIEIGGPPSPKEIEDPDDDDEWETYQNSINNYILETKKLQAIAIKNYTKLVNSSQLPNSKVFIGDDIDESSLIKHLTRETHQITAMEKMSKKLKTVISDYQNNRRERHRLKGWI